MLCSLVLMAHAADVDPFRPAGSLPSGRGTLQGESPFIVGEGFGGGLFTSFAQDLAVMTTEDGRERPLVQRALPTELYGAYTFQDRGLRVEFFAPLYLELVEPRHHEGVALGDLRFQANYALLADRDAFHLSALTRVELPTGSQWAATRRGFLLGVGAAAGGALPQGFGWLANAGLSLAPADELFGYGSGSSFDLLLGGFWTAPEGLRFGAEVDAQLGLVRRERGRNHIATGHVFAQNTLPSGLGLTVGLGTGLVDGVGAPRYRLFTALTFQPTWRDRDTDGIADGDDACPLEPEDRDGFEDEDGCPDLDNDQDGLADADDACPDEPGPEEHRGCPDRDGDGLSDRDDACPDEPGPEALQGCPDRDGDGVPDHRDACPDDPLPPGIDPEGSDGCPRLAYLTEGTITITQKVNFETGKAKVAPSSFELLEAVAAVLREHGSIVKLEVAGHTDNVGSERYNQRLSQRRAEAVRSFLIEAGIEPERLVAKGYGEAVPLTTNRTESGRAKNRRVEFTVLEQTPTLQELPPLPTPEGLDDLWDRPPGSAVEEGNPEPDRLRWEPPPDALPWDAPPDAPSPPLDTGAVPTDAERPTPWDLPPETAPPPEGSAIPEAALAGSKAATPSPSTADDATGGIRSAVVAPPDAVSGGTLDPLGPPAKLTVELHPPYGSATVYVDNEPLPRRAPLDRYPILAGEHRLWIQDDATGLDHEEVIRFYNEAHVRLVFPIGATSEGLEEAPPEEPAPAPVRQRKRRR